MKRMMSRGRYFAVGFVGGMLLVAGQLLLAQQDVAQQYEALTLSDDATGWSERLRECATTLSPAEDSNRRQHSYSLSGWTAFTG